MHAPPLHVPHCSAAGLARSQASCTGCRHVLCPNHARAAAQVLDMIEHGFAKRGINLTTLPARLLYRSAYVVLISFVACTIPFFGVRAAAASHLLRAGPGTRHTRRVPALLLDGSHQPVVVPFMRDAQIVRLSSTCDPGDQCLDLGRLPHLALRVRSPSWASLEPSARGRLRSGCRLVRPCGSVDDQ